MKILIVNTSDKTGGAARAAHRLHKALVNEGVDSQMLVQSKGGDELSVLGPGTTWEKLRGKAGSVLDKMPLRAYSSRSKTPYSPGWLSSEAVVRKINAVDPDIVHLHWVNDGMLGVDSLHKIRAPIVWSLHDMWPFTGGCHYDEACGGYMERCGNCKVLGSNRTRDLSRYVWWRKSTSLKKKSDLTIVALSRWLAECARASSLFGELPIYNLPNPLDTNAFSPVDKAQARALLNLPSGKKLVLFGAMNGTHDPRKGFSELCAALEWVPQQAELVVFGSSGPGSSSPFGRKTHYMGQLHDDVSLRLLYSAADVMVVPSRQENLSNAIMESMGCGTPVAAFDVGGNSDMVDHLTNGYLARPFSAEDLGKGITFLLNSIGNMQFSVQAVAKIREAFDSRAVAKRYIELYKKILTGH